ncbi:hypothetical protein GCM10010112_01340 [Actinoplanes lobatus]|uniref:DUF2029 domain-containing protein n=1 Tax=Actinoplanes lobatus TaxID=113568 RepID=A0A7W7H9L8_9ACTN|nr:hypothetical protein [Actinoplanes lobatus]MBB4746555.1 hypothetical protein [Actinoplanes lobatus]GGN52988.1 hypothetical protein GCM10010112_01340 [Actinoplanes lobatus]GIE38623.1 hypothetical protein Alo02nite_15210 [Actinoplanes lobatus]
MTTTLMDRFVRWNLDFDGDLYGRDERERLRWYEAVTVSFQLQAIVVPWAATALVWTVGEPVAWPLLILLAVFLVPIGFASIYVQSRRVDTTPRTWSRKRLIVSTLLGAPYVAFGIGFLYHAYPESDSWRSALVGSFIGLAAGAVIQAVQTRRVRRRDALLAGDDD